MSRLAFLRSNLRWLAAGFLMALGSSFGQTFFIAIFSDPLRAEFDLSQGAFGLIYMLGTLASALTLIQLGPLADSMAPRRLALVVALGLAAVCAAMALVSSWWMLAFVIFGLRLFGQGMMSHLSQTCMARWFEATRGRALAIAAIGYPTGEALAPLAAVALIAAVGWRATWGAAALTTALIVAPLLVALLARDRTPKGMRARGMPARGMPAPGAPQSEVGLDGRAWRRGEVVRDRLFWLLVPGVLAPGFLITVLFFLPAHIAETKGWSFDAVPESYWIYAVTSVLASLAAGALADRFSARACLPFYQLPMAAGLTTLALGESIESFWATMALVGMSAGAAATLHSAIWAEIYGTRHIGAIKALAHAAMVFATAAGPGICGALIDLGASFPAQAPFAALYVVGVSALYAWLLLWGPLAPAARA